MGDYILSMENITKVYPNGFVANKNVNFAVKKVRFMPLSEKMAPENQP